MGTNILRFFHAPIRFTTFITLYCNISDKDKRCMLRYKRLSNLIELFERKNDVKIYTTSFDRETIGRFVRFLDNCISERTHRHYLRSTIISFMDVLKSLLNIAKDMNYKVDLTGVKNFKIQSEDSGTIFLSIEELQKLNNLKLNPRRSQVRDLFVIGCFTALRLSDYSSLSESNFDLKNNQIRILTQKTKEPVVIPMHPVVREIIDRNGGYVFLQYGRSEYNFNKVLKRIAQSAGFTEEVLIERTRGGQIHRDIKKKYELVSSHTARRTAATNMHLAGIPDFRIMLITGHKSWNSFCRYIRIGKDENAKELQNHPFFNGKF